MECPICFIHFNGSNNLPFVGKCGHTICGQCVPQLKGPCPFCSDDDAFNNAALNFSLRDFLESEGKLGTPEKNDERVAGFNRQRGVCNNCGVSDNEYYICETCTDSEQPQAHIETKKLLDMMICSDCLDDFHSSHKTRQVVDDRLAQIHKRLVNLALEIDNTQKVVVSKMDKARLRVEGTAKFFRDADKCGSFGRMLDVDEIVGSIEESVKSIRDLSKVAESTGLSVKNIEKETHKSIKIWTRFKKCLAKKSKTSLPK